MRSDPAARVLPGAPGPAQHDLHLLAVCHAGPVRFGLAPPEFVEVAGDCMGRGHFIHRLADAKLHGLEPVGPRQTEPQPLPVVEQPVHPVLHSAVGEFVAAEASLTDVAEPVVPVGLPRTSHREHRRPPDCGLVRVDRRRCDWRGPDACRRADTRVVHRTHLEGVFRAVGQVRDGVGGGCADHGRGGVRRPVRVPGGPAVGAHTHLIPPHRGGNVVFRRIPYQRHLRHVRSRPQIPRRIDVDGSGARALCPGRLNRAEQAGNSEQQRSDGAAIASGQAGDAAAQGHRERGQAGRRLVDDTLFRGTGIIHARFST